MTRDTIVSRPRGKNSQINGGRMEKNGTFSMFPSLLVLFFRCAVCASLLFWSIPILKDQKEYPADGRVEKRLYVFVSRA